MAPHTVSLRRTARVLGLLSVVTYNWWVGAAMTGLVSSPDGMFSDLEATGVPHAEIFERLDITSGAFMCLGLLLLGPPAAADRLREWKLMVGFGAAGVIGGMFPYACPEGKDDHCRDLEWHFQLPLHHYIHMVSGIAEFGFATLAIIVMWRRLHGGTPGTWRSVAGALTTGLAIGYPALALSYLSDRWDAPVEAFFFVLFAGMVAAVFLEPEADELPQEIAATATHRAPATS